MDDKCKTHEYIELLECALRLACAVLGWYRICPTPGGWEEYFKSKVKDDPKV